MARNDKVYEMILHVRASSLETMIAVVADTADIVSMKKIDVPQETLPGKSHGKGTSNTSPARKSGKTGPEVLLEHFKPGVSYDVNGLGSVLKAAGFSENSAHPSVSALVKLGKVERHNRGYCRLKAPTVT